MKLKEPQPGTDSKSSSEKPKKKRKDRRVEKEYWDWVEVKDPTTGETIKQKVKITKFKTKGDRFNKKTVVSEEELGYDQSYDEEG